MATGVRSRYHVAINSKGFMLRGGPSSPRYLKEQATSLTSQLGIGDATFSPLTGSGWSYWTQTDWSGGFQNLQWKDNATFKDGQAVDVLSKYGQVSLQNDFTSAISISGGHAYGAHGIHENTLLLGSIKAGAAKLFKITSANSLSTISAMTGISAVNAIERFGDVSLIGMSRTSGTLNTLAKYNGSTLSGFRASHPIVRAVRGIGIRAYISEYVEALSGDQLSYATTLSAFTSAYKAGKNRKIPKISDINGSPYFFITEHPSVEMFKYDEVNERAIPVYKWDNLTNFGVVKHVSFLVITGTSNGKKVAFAFNGARMQPIFDDQLLDSSYDFSNPFVFEDNIQVKGAQWDTEFWSPGLYGKFGNVQYTPFANFNSKAYGYAITGSNMRLAYLNSSRYAISGHVISSEFGGQVAALDKLVNTATINIETLATGQTVEVYRSTDGGATFSSIGKAQYSADGAVNKKTMYFPSGFVTKLWNYKSQLVGPGTSTPKLLDITFEYRPAADLKRRWSLSLDAGDDIQLLNKQHEQRDSKALVGELWLEKEAKRTVVFEDVDAFEVSLTAPMSSTATSALVDSVRLMPPKGRFRIMSANVAEEMTYTSANGGQIKGISRARKGTLARSYTSAHKIDNNYTVIVTDIREQINNTDQDKTESIAQVTLLEV